MTVLEPLDLQRTLSIMPTFRCTAECDHCSTMSSPRENTWLPLDSMLSMIDQAADLGYTAVVFTGGETMLARKPLLLGLKRASSRGLATRVVTNGYWARSSSAAARTLGRMREMGLKEINFSTGDQHARFVPLEYVIRGVRAAVEADMVVALMVELVGGRTITEKVVRSHPEFTQLQAAYPSADIRILESPWMPLTHNKMHRYPKGLAADRHNVHLRGGCDSVLTTTTIEADGKIGACCGIGMRAIPELQVGDVCQTSLSEADQNAADDLLKRWIRLEGPERILAWAAEHDDRIQWEGRYAHRCQACFQLYKDPMVRDVIRRHYTEKLADIVFGEWIMYKAGFKDE